jgi:transposase-like protein
MASNKVSNVMFVEDVGGNLSIAMSKGYPLEIRQQCLDLHAQGISFREIERNTGVSHNTVINWVKNIQQSG